MPNALRTGQTEKETSSLILEKLRSETGGYNETGGGAWTVDSLGSAAYPADEPSGLYRLAASAEAEYHYTGSGESDYMRTEGLITETWDYQWADAFDGTYSYSREEAGLIEPDGLVGAYSKAENSDETYTYSGTYEYGWDDSLDPYVSGTRSAEFTEGLTIHWVSSYEESGALGPGGSVGVYESSDTLTLDYVCSGGGQLNLVYHIDENTSHTADEVWTFSGEDHYSLTVTDAGNFDEDGDHGLAVSTETDEGWYAYQETDGDLSIYDDETYYLHFMKKSEAENLIFPVLSQYSCDFGT